MSQGGYGRGGQQRQGTGPPTAFTNLKPGTGTSWLLPVSSPGSYSKHGPAMLAMPPASSSSVPCSSQVTAQNANNTGAEATDGDQNPKPRFHSQVL